MGVKLRRSAPRKAALDDEPIAGQRLAADDLAQVVGEMLERREAAGFGVQMNEVETPAALLAAAVLAHEAIEPALQAAGQVEIRPVDGEHERFIQHAGVEPVRQDQLQSERPAVHDRPSPSIH